MCRRSNCGRTRLLSTLPARVALLALEDGGFVLPPAERYLGASRQVLVPVAAVVRRRLVAKDAEARGRCSMTVVVDAVNDEADASDRRDPFGEDRIEIDR